MTNISTSRRSRPKPGRWQKRFMDLPVYLYRFGLGFLFGSRLVVLVHRGRTSGAERHTTLEVLQHRPVDGEYRVLSGWGRTSDWFRNIEAAPPIGLWVGHRRQEVEARELAADEATRAVADHLRKNPKVSARIAPDLWSALQKSTAALQEALTDQPVVGFRPIGDQPEEPPGKGLLAALEGLALIVYHFLATPLIGRNRLRWGTVGTEATDSLSGDELIPDPKWTYTLAVEIAAAPEAVWPWVAQIGQQRGGFYSYQTLENMFGCRIANTTQILPQYQSPAVGDEIYLHPSSPSLEVRIVEPPHALVLFGSPAEVSDDKGWGVSTWQFVTVKTSAGNCRLLTRGRSDYTPGFVNRLFFGRFPMEVVTFVMNRKMLLEIKRLAEKA
ncbi:MAG: nitroreductase family deazaflavin-dependent oxidoreductase [Acidimicrobiia bacterium]|nr:nitroreductase family deazaflavin-dependent oxidoreductase [Acidimicrobiia bacterium]